MFNFFNRKDAADSKSESKTPQKKAASEETDKAPNLKGLGIAFGRYSKMVKSTYQHSATHLDEVQAAATNAGVSAIQILEQATAEKLLPLEVIEQLSSLKSQTVEDPQAEAADDWENEEQTEQEEEMEERSQRAAAIRKNHMSVRSTTAVVLISLVVLIIVGLAALLVYTKGNTKQILPPPVPTPQSTASLVKVPEVSPSTNGLLKCRRTPQSEVQLFTDRAFTQQKGTANPVNPYLIYPLKEGGATLVSTDVGYVWGHTGDFIPEANGNPGLLTNGTLAGCEFVSADQYPDVVKLMSTVAPAQTFFDKLRQVVPWMIYPLLLMVAITFLAYILESVIHPKLTGILAVVFWVIFGFCMRDLYSIGAPLAYFKHATLLMYAAGLWGSYKSGKGELKSASAGINFGASGSGQVIDEWEDTSRPWYVRLIGQFEMSELMLIVVPALALMGLQPDMTPYSRMANEMSVFEFGLWVLAPFAFSILFESASRGFHSTKKGGVHVSTAIASVLIVSVLTSYTLIYGSRFEVGGIFAGILAVAISAGAIGFAAVKTSDPKVPLLQMDAIADMVVWTITSGMITTVLLVLYFARTVASVAIGIGI